MTKQLSYSFIATAIVMLAVNMRMPIIGFGNLLPFIGQELTLSLQMTGIFGAIPMIAFGASSVFAPKLSAKIGLEKTLAYVAGLLFVSMILRVTGGVSVLLIGTIVLSLAISVSNVIIPAVIKKYAKQRIAQLTALYSMTLSVCAGVGSALMIPITQASNWRVGLSAFAVFSLVAMVFWVVILRTSQQDTIASNQKNSTQQHNLQAISKNFWISPVAWSISLFMGLQSLLYYTLATFLPTWLVARGMTDTHTGVVVMVLQTVAVPSTLFLSFWLKRNFCLQTIAIIACLSNMFGVLGFGFGSLDWVYLWAVLTGFGCGVAFTLSLTLFGLKTQNPSDTAKLSGMAQSVGYGVAFFGPMMTGVLYEWLQSWQSISIILAVIMAIKAIFAWIATSERLI